jgi:hypothetical protein
MSTEYHGGLDRDNALIRAKLGLGDSSTKDVGLIAGTVAPGDVVGGDDAAHAASHENGGAVEISVAGLSGLLADAQTPTTHATAHQNGGADEIGVGGLSGLLADSQTPLAHRESHEPGGADMLRGVHRSSLSTYISGTGTAGTDNTAMTIKTIALPADTLTQVGERVRFRCYFQATGGAPIIAATLLNAVLISDVSVSTTSLGLTEAWLHYIDNTHANIIHMHDGSLSTQSAVNVAGFDWDSSQDITFTQDAVPAQHLVLYTIIVDVFPLGVV